MGEVNLSELRARWKHEDGAAPCLIDALEARVGEVESALADLLDLVEAYRPNAEAAEIARAVLGRAASL